MRNPSILVAAILALVTLSGCTSTVPGPAAVEPSPTPPTDPTGYHWEATMEGAVVLDFTLAPAAATDCSVTWRWLPVDPPAGFDGFIVEHGEPTSPWMLVGSRWHEAQARGPMVDTRDLLTPYVDDGWMEIQWPFEGLDAPVRLTLGARGLAEGDGSPNLRFDLGCAAPFTIDAAQGGRSFELFEARSLSTGVAASSDVWPARGGVGLLQRVEVDSKAPRTLVLLSEAYEHWARATLTHPNGTIEYDMPPRFDSIPLHRFEGPKGRYVVEFNEVDLGGSLWGLIAGLHPVSDLADVGRMKAADPGCPHPDC